jgi:8-oxo-dGTP diphosphatase
VKRPGGEAEYLAAYDPGAFERPSVAVDVALIAATGGQLRTFLVKRDRHPFRGRWALPGTFVGMAESLDGAARRALQDKAGVRGVFLEQLYTFGRPGRDPRTRVISVAYYALVEAARLPASLATARIVVPWEGETGGPVQVVDEEQRALALAFDHHDILGMAVLRLRGKLDYAPIGFQLLGDTFTLLELQRVHETVLGRELNKDSFRRRMLASGQLQATGKMQSGAVHRPAELYRFVRKSAL